MPILIVLLALAGAAWVGFMAAAGGQVHLMLAAGSALVVIFAFFSPKLSLVFLIFSMLLSPEIGFGAVDRFRSLVIRYDDIFIALIFLSWFVRTAIHKDKPFITSTPVQTPVLLYTALCIVSTALGVMRGDLNWTSASLYVLKYVEYFLLFFMTVNIVESEEDVNRFLKYGLIVFVIVTLYAYYYYYASGVTSRATAPFEAPIGNSQESEPASLGGYFIIVFGILFGIMSEMNGRASMLALSMLMFAFPAFLFTYSRASYIGFAAMVPALMFFSQKRRLFLIGFLAAGTIGFLMVPNIKNRVFERITMTYSGAYATQAFNVAGAGQIKLEESAAARVRSMKRTVFERLPEHPVIGRGVTGIGMGDTQYALVLGELGILGAILFIWMIVRLFRTARTVYLNYESPLIRALSLGFMIALIALLFQALGVNTFIVVRIMEPFWFLAALLSVLYIRIKPSARSLAFSRA